VQQLKMEQGWWDDKLRQHWPPQQRLSFTQPHHSGVQGAATTTATAIDCNLWRKKRAKPETGHDVTPVKISRSTMAILLLQYRLLYRRVTFVATSTKQESCHSTLLVAPSGRGPFAQAWGLAMAVFPRNTDPQ
jgi:hypothetical protein